MLGDLRITSPLVIRFRDCFRSEDLPRTRPSLGGNSTYSKAGNYLINGTSFKLPHFWTVNAYVPIAIANRVNALWTIRENTRMTGSILQIPLEDETQLFYEETTLAAKTRSAVTGSESLAYEADGGCYYYARFVTDIDTPPVLGKISDGFQSVVFTLRDTGVLI